MAARPQASDYLQNFRFHVTTDDGSGSYIDPVRGEAGFNSVSIPEISAESTEYKEGHMTYTQKFPGAPTVGDVSLQRGKTKSDTSFYDWMMRVVNGGEYRTNLIIYQWPRDGKQKGIGDLTKAVKMVCYEAFPTRMKPGGDLDATSSEISMQELDVAIESYEIVNPS